MNHFYKTFFVLVAICFSSTAFAANRFWVSAIPLNWSNAAGWSAVSGGAPGASVPGAADAVFFDNNGLGNCNGDIPVTVTSISVAGGYSGTISQNANTMVLSGAATLGGGTFAGGSANITVGGAFTLSGMIFTSTTAILELRDNAAFTSGTFTHNNGTVRFNCINNAAETITGTAPVFYTLEFTGVARTYTLSTLVGNITVINSLNTSGTLFYNLAGGVIDVKGDINSNNTATGSGGDALININGAGIQNFNGSSVAGTGALTKLTINKASGTLNLTNFPGVSNNFTYIAGTISPGTSTFCFTHGNTGAYSISGSLTFNSIDFPVNTGLLTITIPVATTLTATGDLTIAGAGNLVLNTGNINVNGNILLTNTGPGGGGSTTINIVGTGAETMDGTAIVVNQSRLPVVNINKTSGTLSLLGNISFSANLTYITGTINAGTSNCYIVNNLMVTGNFSLFNLFISPAGNTTITVAAGSTVTVLNNFDLENGANNITINTGTIAVQGNVVDNNTGVSGGGSATILMNGTGAQNITSSGIIYQGSLPGVSINKTTGTLTFPALITIRGNYTYTTGTLDVTNNNSTVVFANFLTITGSHTLNNIVFDAGGNYTITVAAATVLTTAGNMTISGVNSMTINTGTINLNGNLILTNTGVLGGGNAVIGFVSALNQSITGTLLINQSTLPGVTINKPAGILLFPAMITVRSNWTYLAGTLDVTTNNATIVFSNTLTITGTHTLNNVNFEGSFNNSYTVPTGTILTISGTLTLSGASNVSINTTINAATAIQAQGDIVVTNTAAAGGGVGKILINGTGAQTFTSSVAAGQGRMPYINIQKTSGTLTLSGIISESRDWTYSSGTVSAGTSTTAFGGNNLSVNSAGMTFNNVTVFANTTTLNSNISVAGNLSIINVGTLLLPVANTINLGGNWSDYGTAGFTEAASTVNFNGTALQTVTTPGGENFTNMTINNSGAGIQLVNNVTAATTLAMTQGNVDLNNNTLALGLSAANFGTLVYTSGTIINTGTFTRWFKVAAIAAGSPAGLFPMGTATDYRPLFLSGTGPATGGTIAMTYTDATTNSAVSISDPPFTVVVQKNLKWQLTTANGLAGGTYNMQIQGTGYGLIGLVSDLRITLAASVVGAAGTNAGATSNPQINRTGLAATDLSNTFFIGSINAVSSPLPVTLVYFVALPKNQTIDLQWETAIETQNDYFTVLRSRDGGVWDSVTRVNGHGNTSENTFYETFDYNPYNGLSYYRLKNTDRDGKEYFSSIQRVNFGKDIDQINVYPNPAASTIIVTSGSEITSVKLLNTVGQMISFSKSPGHVTQTINVSSLPAGTYFIQITHGGITETKTVIINR